MMKKMMIKKATTTTMIMTLVSLLARASDSFSTLISSSAGE